MKIRGEYKVVKIDQVKPNTWNPKDDITENEANRLQFEMLGETISRDGFIDPILVRSVEDGYEIIDGKHRYLQAINKEATEIPVIDLGEVDDNEAKALTIKAEKIKVQLNDVKVDELTREIFDSLNQDLSALTDILPVIDEEFLSKVTVNVEAVSTGSTQPIEGSNQGAPAQPAKSTGTIVFKYDYQKYLNLLAQIKNAQEKLKVDSIEAALEVLLQEYV